MASQVRKSFKLFVGRLPWTVSRRVLREYFQQFGPVKQAAVVFDLNTGMSKGFGFVQFGSRDSYMAAISQEHHVIDDYRVLVAAATSRKPATARESTKSTSDEITSQET